MNTIIVRCMDVLAVSASKTSSTGDAPHFPLPASPSFFLLLLLCSVLSSYLNVMCGLLSSSYAHHIVVRMQTMHLLGLLAERFPDEMIGRDAFLLDIFLSNLQQEVRYLIVFLLSNGISLMAIPP